MNIITNDKTPNKQSVNLIMSKKSIQLCCGSKRCPTLTLEGNNVRITDDYGKSIRIEVEQAKLIGKALKELGK